MRRKLPLLRDEEVDASEVSEGEGDGVRNNEFNEAEDVDDTEEPEIERIFPRQRA